MISEKSVSIKNHNSNNGMNTNNVSRQHSSVHAGEAIHSAIRRKTAVHDIKHVVIQDYKKVLFFFFFFFKKF